MSDEDEDEYVEEPTPEYLRGVAEKLRHVAPIYSDMDGGDVDRLQEIATEIEKAQEAIYAATVRDDDKGNWLLIGDTSSFMADIKAGRVKFIRESDLTWDEECGMWRLDVPPKEGP